MGSPDRNECRHSQNHYHKNFLHMTSSFPGYEKWYEDDIYQKMNWLKKNGWIQGSRTIRLKKLDGVSFFQKWWPLTLNTIHHFRKNKSMLMVWLFLDALLMLTFLFPWFWYWWNLIGNPKWLKNKWTSKFMKYPIMNNALKKNFKGTHFYLWDNQLGSKR